MRGEPEYQDKNLLNRGGLKSNHNINPASLPRFKLKPHPWGRVLPPEKNALYLSHYP